MMHGFSFREPLLGGGPSQPEKVDGGEHPMWIVSSTSPLGAGRTSFTGSGGKSPVLGSWAMGTSSNLGDFPAGRV